MNIYTYTHGTYLHGARGSVNTMTGDFI